MNKYLRSILRTAMYVIDQFDSASSNLRDHVSDHADRVSDRLSDIADRGHDIIYGEDHTLRHILLFAAGVGVGVGAGMLLAPTSGEELRSNMRNKVQDIGDRVRDRVSSETQRRTTGTEGGV
ncbi:MAG TPA: YtxH domain-containing protein [Candidatus Sulfotelmatobacter sp.]|nr:YtxH domain-containing protein [Candidatus Sulfotelmatobacter sp.]